jgi:nucleoid-associated protein EbfC
MSDAKMPDLGNLMNLAQKLQGDVAKMQDSLARMTCEASSGGGMVTATVNGGYELVKLAIEKEVVVPEDVEMLQDLVVVAVNEAIKKSQEMMQEEMAKITGGMNLPGLF